MAMAMATTSPWTAMSVGNRVSSSRNSPLRRLCAASFHKRGVHCRSLSSHRAVSYSASARRARGVARATIEEQEEERQGEEEEQEEEQEEEEEEQEATVSIKEFLEDLKAIGRTRLIVNTGVAVLESTVSSLDKLFYHTVSRGEYANLMLKEENVDFHLLIDLIVSAKLETKMRGDTPVYLIRFMDRSGALAASLLVMWKPDSNGDFDDGQEEAYQNLLEKYGSDITFGANPSQ